MNRLLHWWRSYFLYRSSSLTCFWLIFHFEFELKDWLLRYGKVNVSTITKHDAQIWTKCPKFEMPIDVAGVFSGQELLLFLLQTSFFISPLFESRSSACLGRGWAVCIWSVAFRLPQSAFSKHISSSLRRPAPVCFSFDRHDDSVQHHPLLQRRRADQL